MWIKRLQIENFRGLKDATIEFGDRQTVLVGPNGAGKSTILEALALLFGREGLVRDLTEHDFFGSDPKAADRIRLIATLTGFPQAKPSANSGWFAENRGVPKWLDHQLGKIVPKPGNEKDQLCVQIGFCARFDRVDLDFETIRYFHDDDAVLDPFDDDAVQRVPAKNITELGFFLIPAHRTWDRLISFNSALFKKILSGSGPLEAVEVLSERDRLRADGHRVDLEGSLKAIREGINAQLLKLLPGTPELQLRLTSTDSVSLLNSLVPHYQYEGAPSLPAARHGSGLLSIQTALLILQIAERRQKASQNVIVAIEEPELHMPPGVQGQVLHQLRSCSSQLVCTTHSPRVAAVYPATDVRVLCSRKSNANPVAPLLAQTLPSTAKNGVRKLFQESRQQYIEALLHRFVLVPEGRVDVEWLRLLTWCAIASQDLTKGTGTTEFGVFVGMTPTHDACVAETVGHAMRVRDGVTALVDGDAAGDDYVATLVGATASPEHIFQWPTDWTIEDILGWVLSAEADLPARVQVELPSAPASVPAIVAWLKKETKLGGAKTDYLAYEVIASVILTSEPALARVRDLLSAFVAAIKDGKQSALLKTDSVRSTKSSSVWRFQL